MADLRRTREEIRHWAADECLSKTNIEVYSPSGDYNPATKKYVDDRTTGAGLGDVSGPGIPVVDGNLASWDGTTGTSIEDSGIAAADVLTWASQIHTHSNYAILEAVEVAYTTALNNKLAGIESGAEVNNLSDLEADELTDGSVTTLHTHNHDDLASIDPNEHIDWTATTEDLETTGTVETSRLFINGSSLTMANARLNTQIDGVSVMALQSYYDQDLHRFSIKDRTDSSWHAMLDFVITDPEVTHPSGPAVIVQQNLAVSGDFTVDGAMYVFGGQEVVGDLQVDGNIRQWGSYIVLNDQTGHSGYGDGTVYFNDPNDVVGTDQAYLRVQLDTTTGIPDSASGQPAGSFFLSHGLRAQGDISVGSMLPSGTARRVYFYDLSGFEEYLEYDDTTNMFTFSDNLTVDGGVNVGGLLSVENSSLSSQSTSIVLMMDTLTDLNGMPAYSIGAGPTSSEGFIEYRSGTALTGLHGHRFTVNGIEVLTIRGDGRVGINNSSPAYSLDATGNANFTGSGSFGGSLSSGGTFSAVTSVQVGSTTIFSTATSEIGTDLYVDGSLYVDTIDERTSGAGVTIEGVLIRDGGLSASGIDITSAPELTLPISLYDQILVEHGGSTMRADVGLLPSNTGVFPFLTLTDTTQDQIRFPSNGGIGIGATSLPSGNGPSVICLEDYGSTISIPDISDSILNTTIGVGEAGAGLGFSGDVQTEGKFIVGRSDHVAGTSQRISFLNLGGDGTLSYNSVDGFSFSPALPQTETLPDQTGYGGRYLKTDGSTATWEVVAASGGGSSESIEFEVYNDSGATISYGDPIRLTGTSSGGVPVVEAINAGAGYPCHGLMKEPTLTGNSGVMVVEGIMDTLNTTPYAIGTKLYMSDVAGLTDSRPTGYVQEVCTTINRTNPGKVYVRCGWVQEQEHLAEGYIVIGDSNDEASEATLSSAIDALSEIGGMEPPSSGSLGQILTNDGDGTASWQTFSAGAVSPGDIIDDGHALYIPSSYVNTGPMVSSGTHIVVATTNSPFINGVASTGDDSEIRFATDSSNGTIGLNLSDNKFHFSRGIYIDGAAGSLEMDKGLTLGALSEETTASEVELYFGAQHLTWSIPSLKFDSDSEGASGGAFILNRPLYVDAINSYTGDLVMNSVGLDGGNLTLNKDGNAVSSLFLSETDGKIEYDTATQVVTVDKDTTIDGDLVVTGSISAIGGIGVKTVEIDCGTITAPTANIDCGSIV